MPIHLLLVEDNPADALFLRTALNARYPGEYETMVAASLAEANSLLARQTFQAVLLDLSLPDSQGLETIGRLTDAAHNLPVVVLTGVVDDKVVPEAVRRGAQDYLVKGKCDGEMIGRAIGYAMHRKRIEEELRQARDELETRVQQRTEELARSNAECLLAKEAAEAASRAKSTFLANMSHEMRTPLNGVIGITDLVLKGQLPAKERELLLMVKDSGEMLLRLIDDILDLSRIEAGKLTLAREPFDLEEKIRVTMKPFAVRAHQHGLQLHWHAHPDVPREVMGDYPRLRQIIVNLIGNAIKFTEHGEVSLEVTVDARSNHDVLLHFIVRDTGIGIAAEKQAKIFEMFEQADNSLARRHGGSGLGLSIASRLVELMDGRIWVESQIGHGSSFHFTARLEVAPPREDPMRAAAGPLQSNQRQSKLNVLLAEDSLVNQRLVAALLEEEGHRVTVVDNGAKLLMVLDSNQFDLVLMDIQMPEMDGLEATTRIRAKERETGKHIPIIALTAHAFDANHEQCLDAGMERCLTKPIQADELFDAIDAVVRNGSPRDT